MVKLWLTPRPSHGPRVSQRFPMGSVSQGSYGPSGPCRSQARARFWPRDGMNLDEFGWWVGDELGVGNWNHTNHQPYVCIYIIWSLYIYIMNFIVLDSAGSTPCKSEGWTTERRSILSSSVKQCCIQWSMWAEQAQVWVMEEYQLLGVSWWIWVWVCFWFGLIFEEILTGRKVFSSSANPHFLKKKTIW